MNTPQLNLVAITVTPDEFTMIKIALATREELWKGKSSGSSVTLAKKYRELLRKLAREVTL
jgi:hypothetical protein